ASDGYSDYPMIYCRRPLVYGATRHGRALTRVAISIPSNMGMPCLERGNDKWLSTAGPGPPQRTTVHHFDGYRDTPGVAPMKWISRARPRAVRASHAGGRIGFCKGRSLANRLGPEWPPLALRPGSCIKHSQLRRQYVAGSKNTIVAFGHRKT